MRKEVFKTIPNFSKLNELPNFKDCELINTSPYFESEEVYIKNWIIFLLTLFQEPRKRWANVDRSSIVQKKLAQIIYDRVFRNFGSRGL